jgi:hypothetical protein
MSFIKLLIVLAICGAQVYFTTSFFTQKGNRSRNRGVELNPFANSVM